MTIAAGPDRYQYVTMPTCRRCGDVDSVRIYHTKRQDDRSKLRYAICRRCGCKWLVVAEPDPKIPHRGIAARGRGKVGRAQPTRRPNHANT